MSGPALKVTSLLDEAEDLVRALGGRWLGLLCLSQLPLRFAECTFWAFLWEFGGDVTHYGDGVHVATLWIALALPLALYGRAVYARAGQAQWSRETVTGLYPLRVPPANLLNYLAVALLLEILFLILGWTLLALPILGGLAGVAAANSALQQKAGVLGALGRLVEHSIYVRALIGLAMVLGIALLVTWTNLLAVLSAGVWLLGDTLGFDLAAWRILWSPSNPYFLLWAWAGTRILVEPFWLASHVVYVNKVRSRSSGDDLSRRFSQILRSKEMRETGP